MKLAVCLFGHVGTVQGRDIDSGWINPLISYQNYVDNVFQDAEVDVFIHTWSTEYDDVLLNSYNPKSFLIEPQIDFSKIGLDRYSLKHLDTYRDHFYNYGDNTVSEVIKPLIFRSHSRWYSAKKSVDLMRDYSLENNIKYDWVMQLRFDIRFFKKIRFSDLDKMYFYSSLRDKEIDTTVNDLWFISNQKNAENFSTLFDNIYHYSIRPPYATKQHLDVLGIEVRSFFRINKDFSIARYLMLNKNVSIFIRIKNKSIMIILKITNKIIKILERINDLCKKSMN
jgi:hypothetical protein